jgi:hypothetical protein
LGLDTGPFPSHWAFFVPVVSFGTKQSLTRSASHGRVCGDVRCGTTTENGPLSASGSPTKRPILTAEPSCSRWRAFGRGWPTKPRRTPRPRDPNAAATAVKALTIQLFPDGPLTLAVGFRALYLFSAFALTMPSRLALQHDGAFKFRPRTWSAPACQWRPSCQSGLSATLHRPAGYQLDRNAPISLMKSCHAGSDGSGTWFSESKITNLAFGIDMAIRRPRSNGTALS